MNNYSSIKELVIDTCASEGQFPSYEKLTSLVLENFPSSKWQKTHYAWYKSQIKRGEIVVPGAIMAQDSQDETTDSEVEETIEASLSLERDLHSYLARMPSDIEPGLQLVEGGVEYQTEAGRVDLLCNGSNGELVVIELKAGKARDAAVGQLLGYIGSVQELEPNRPVRGVIVASDFDPRVVLAAKASSNIKLLKYRVAFQLDEVR
ncbi:DUF91 domain-containing protein [Natronospirillum operosum]|uniref:DUF91 domain-containing protein n=1 Tax=Natronospirillum operosum TaxID=2759953 RepID=A0A4Z0W820_9GAMM|nr:endonuclease NucS domain-containing protein [Natronospirillum operosum]TGG92887.1 DUF91 domain-containing protein [Natronospirillum operosum]